MVSRNKLLGSGKSEEAEVEVVVQIPVKAPAWRYSAEFPEGKIFKTDEALVAADASGWKDHPGKVRSLPGFEGMVETD